MEKPTIFVRTASNCKDCPLRDQQRVWGRGELANGVALLGEAPGEDEASSGVPFIGRAGNRLSSGLFKAGINRKASWLTNVICCRPPGNNIKSFEAQEAQEHCRRGLEQELRWLQEEGLKVIVALGGTSLKGLTNEAPSITKARGSIYMKELNAKLPQVPIVPTFHPSYILRGMHYKKDEMHVDKTLVWYADLKKAKHIAEEGWQPPVENFNIWPNVSDLEDFLNEAKDQGQSLAVDIETSGLRADTCKVFVIGLARTHEDAICVPLYGLNMKPYWQPEEETKVRELLNEAFTSFELMFQNALFDVIRLQRAGFTLPWSQVKHDSMMLHHTLTPELPHDLGFIVSLYGETPYWKEEFNFRTEAIYQMDQDQLRTYNCRDCVVLHQVVPKMLNDLQTLGGRLEAVYHEEAIKLLGPVGMMMSNGIAFDKKALEAYRRELEAEQKKLITELYDIGLPKAFNLNSGDDLRWLFFRRPPSKFKKLKDFEKKRKGTKVYEELKGLKDIKEATPVVFDCRRLPLPGAQNGNVTLNDEGRLSLRIHLQNELERLEARSRRDALWHQSYEGVKRLLRWLEDFNEYKKVTKILTTYFKFTPWTDGRVHCEFLPHGTATSRLSSRNPNLQQLPKKRKGIRKAFVASKDHVLVSADYSNLEVRVLAEVANDDVLREEVKHNVHDCNTRTLFGLGPEDKMWPAARRAAKVFMFGGISYGGGPKEIHKKIVTEVPELNLTYKRFLQAQKKWFQEHPAYQIWAEKVKAKALDERVSEIFSGRIRQLFGGERDIMKEALNTPIQGGAARIVNMASIRLAQRIIDEGLPMKMLLQIHDQLVFDVKEDHLEELAKIIKSEMEAPVKINDREVSFPVDVDYGPNLEDLKELTV